MKVRTLIARLREFDPDCDVVVARDDEDPDEPDLRLADDPTTCEGFIQKDAAGNWRVTPSDYEPAVGDDGTLPPGVLRAVIVE